MDRNIAREYQLCPVMLYKNFCSTKDKNENSIRIDNFENDMQKLLDAGYQSISIAQIEECRSKQIPLPEKAFCILLYGGYIDHYTLAFPVIKKLGIHADALIESDLVGVVNCPGVQDYCPRYDWNQANEMHISKLVDFYASCHSVDSKIDAIESAVQEKINLINMHIKGENAKKLFHFDTYDDVKKHILKKLNIPLYLDNFLTTTPEKLQDGLVPYIDVDPNFDIFDVIDCYCETCTARIKRIESILSQNDQTVIWTPTQNWDSICLPIEEKPLIRNYLRHAIPLSVLAADRKSKAELVVLNSYIDVVFRPWYHWFDYDNHLYDAWNCITCCRLNREMIVAAKINVADYVLQGLHEGYYSDLWLDTYYIPGKPAYGKRHLSHWVLIYGYESETHCFCALSYTNTGHYERLDVYADDLLKACSTDHFTWIDLLKVNKIEPIVYKKNLIAGKLRGYVQSEYNTMDYTKYNCYDNNQLFNWNACKAFPDYLLSTGEREKKIYTVALYGFLEHKKCMGWRLDYIASREKVQDQELQAFAAYAERQYDKLLKLAMKYNITQDDKILQNLVNQCAELVEKERENILRLLSLLEL